MLMSQLANNGAMYELCIKIVEVLTKIHKSSTQPDLDIYQCEGNAVTLVKTILCDEPSGVEIKICSKHECTAIDENPL